MARFGELLKLPDVASNGDPSCVMTQVSAPAHAAKTPVILHSEAVSHLAALLGRAKPADVADLKAFTFQTFPDKPGGDARALTRVLHGSYQQHRAALAALNLKGAGVYVVVNETDGKGRKAENVVRVRAHFVDLDGSPHDPALNWMLTPSFAIESSPGKFHDYWLGGQLDDFRFRQRQLASLFGGDPKCIDLPRVLRLAGYIHQKADPFRVRFVKRYNGKPRFSAEQFQTALANVALPSTDNGAPASQEPLVELDQQHNIDWAMHYLKRDAPYSQQGSGGEAALLQVAATLKDHGISEQLAIELIDQHYNQWPICEPEWQLDGPPEDSIRVKVHNAYTYLTQEPPGSKTAEAEFAEDPLSEDELKKFAASDAALRAKSSQGKSSTALDIIRGDEIEMQNVDWIWFAHLALGQHTCLAGVQGDGKSQVVYALVAAVTRGRKWPGSEEHAPLGNVVILSAEDTDKDVLGPRLFAAGADMSRVRIVKATRFEGGKRKFNLLSDIGELKKAALEIGDVKLISFDPVTSYLGKDLDSNSVTELRDALDPITAMAEATGSAVISVTHFKKEARGVSALNRIIGGIGFTAAPRAAFAVVRDPDDPNNGRLLLPVKANLMSFDDAYGMSFHIEKLADIGAKDKRNGTPISSTRVVWDDVVGLTADEVLNPKAEAKPEGEALREAKEFLINMLEDGPLPCKDVEHEAKDASIAAMTLRRAREALGIKSTKSKADPGQHSHGKWMWALAADLLGEEFPE